MGGTRCTQCGRVMSAGDRFCSGCGAALSAEAPPQQRRDVRASREEMFAHLRSGETRLATILMSDVSGFSSLSSNADPEWIFNLINQVLAELVECLVGHGAHIDNYVGDEVVALFGVPIAQEHSAERALLAALAMQDRMRALNEERRFGEVQLQMHTGINIGRVMVGPIGHGAHTDYTVIGDSVNLAKRLEDAAPPGEIYVSADVRDAVGDGFAFEEVGPLKLAGIEREVHTLRVVGADQARLSQREVQSERRRAIARHRELSELEGLAQFAADGAPAVGAIVGPPGIGKSRLISDWRRGASASEFRVVSTTCHACGAYFPLLPLADVAARLAGLQLRGWPPSLVGDKEQALGAIALSSGSRDILGELLDLIERAPNRDLQEFPRRLARAFAELIGGLSEERPLCVIIEDLEWLDDASGAVLAELMGELSGRVLMLLSARDPAPGWLDAEGVRTVKVMRLPRVVMRSLIEEWISPQRLPRTTIEAICTRADGHPHFARELVNSLRNRSPKWTDSDVGLPGSLQELFLSQLDGLALPVRRVVQAISIVGEPLSLEIIPYVLDSPVVSRDAIGQVINEGLLVPGAAADQFVFGPRLLFEVAYSTIPPTQRRALHERTADHLVERISQGDEALVHTAAHHAYFGYGDERAIDLLLHSATIYKAQYSLRQSIMAAMRAGEVIGAIQTQSDHHRQKLEALLLLAQCHEVIGELDEAEASIAEAEVLAEECDDGELVAKVLTTAGTLLLMQGDPDAAESRYRDALAIWQRLGNRTRAAHVAVGMGLSAGQRGHREQAVALFAQAAATEDAEEWVRAAAENNLGMMLIDEGRYAEAEPHLLRGLEANQRDGDRRGVAQSRCSLGELCYRLARLPEAREALNGAAAVAEETEDTLCLLLARALLSRVSCALDNPTAPETIHALSACPPPVEVAFWVASADYALAAGDDAALRELLAELRDLSEPEDNAGVELLTLGLEGALQIGDAEAGELLSARLRRASDAATDRCLTAYADWLLQVATGKRVAWVAHASASRTSFDLRAERICERLQL